MRRLLQNKSVVASLVAVAGLCIAANFVKGIKGSSSSIAARVAPENESPALISYPIRPTLRASAALVDWQLTASANTLARDPFRRIARKTAATNAIASVAAPIFAVQAISIEANRAFAVINRRVLGQGESIDGYVVDRIQPTQVWLSGPAGSILVPVRRFPTQSENIPTGK